MGTILKIWVKRARGGPMDARGRVRLEAERGIEGNANLGGRRQVVLIERERWEDVCEAVGAEVDPVLRRANLFVEGVPLAGGHGRVLAVGECRLRVGGETPPCRKMEESHAGLQEAMRPDWRGGAFAEVLTGGEIAVGDAIAWLDGEASAP